MAAAVPAQRERPLLTMADMGHGGMSGMDHGNRAGMDHSQMQQSEEPPATEQPMSELDHAAMGHAMPQRSEEHTSELQSLMRISYAVFCLQTKKSTHRLTTI